MDEKGYSWEISSTQYLAQKKFYPSIVSSQDAGFLIPFIRNSSFWSGNTGIGILPQIITKPTSTTYSAPQGEAVRVTR